MGGKGFKVKVVEAKYFKENGGWAVDGRTV